MNELLILGLVSLILSGLTTEETVQISVTDNDFVQYQKSLRQQDNIETKDVNGKQIMKTFSAEEKKIKISTDSETDIEFQLLTSYNKWVENGTDVLIAELFITEYDNLENIFDSISFYDMKNNYSDIKKEYWYKYGTEYTVEECFDAFEQLPELKEETIICQNVTHTNWTRFDELDELEFKTDLKIGVFTNTIGDKKIEWVGEIKGFKLFEFASYELVGMASYYDADGEYSVDYISALAVTSDGNYLITSSAVDYYVSIMLINDTEAVGEDTTPPTSNSPSDASYEQNSSHTISWILTDNVAGGYYNITRNGTLQNESLAWISGITLNVWINTSEIGYYNYTIFYNDSSGNVGTPDEVMINITEEAANTCICPGAGIDHEFNLADYCIIQECTAKDITFTGPGNITFNGSITAQSIGALPANQEGFLTENAEVLVSE